MIDYRPKAEVTMKFVTLLLSALLQSGAGWAASAVLIPTLYVGSGAFDSRWNTVVVLNNLSATAFTNSGVRFVVMCTPDNSCESDAVPPGAFASIATPRPANGLLLYLPSDDAAITFTARIAAAPRNADTEGTELPIARESSFTRRPIQFPYVPYRPLRNPFRTTLRIYALDAT